MQRRCSETTRRRSECCHQGTGTKGTGEQNVDGGDTAGNQNNQPQTRIRMLDAEGHGWDLFVSDQQCLLDQKHTSLVAPVKVLRGFLPLQQYTHPPSIAKTTTVGAPVCGLQYELTQNIYIYIHEYDIQLSVAMHGKNMTSTPVLQYFQIILVLRHTPTATFHVCSSRMNQHCTPSADITHKWTSHYYTLQVRQHSMLP